MATTFSAGMSNSKSPVSVSPKLGFGDHFTLVRSPGVVCGSRVRDFVAHEEASADEGKHEDNAKADDDLYVAE